MSKTLVLIRHAQAEQPHLTEDSKRKLTAKGKSDANELGYLLKEQGLKKPIIISSYAERALNTAKLIAPAVEVTAAEVIVENTLYDAAVNDLLRFINKLDNQWSLVAIVAHNPAISFTAEYLTNENSLGFSPSSAATIRFDIEEWGMITQGSGSLLDFKTVF